MGENFLNSLQIMWQGMFGIFAVMILILIVVMVLAKVTHKK